MPRGGGLVPAQFGSCQVGKKLYEIRFNFPVLAAILRESAET
jgi:hypothetical protein